MACQEGHVISSLQDLIVQPETTFNTDVPLKTSVVSDATGGPVKVLTSSFGRTKPQEYRDDARQGLMDEGVIDGLEEYPWTLEHNIVPISSGNFPELHTLLSSIFNTHDAGTQTYTAGAMNCRHAMQMLRANNDVGDRQMLEVLNGAITNSMTVRGQGGSKPNISFSGKAARRRVAKSAKVTSGGGAGAINLDTTLTPNPSAALDATLEAAVFTAGALDDNGGAGYPVSIAGDSAVLVGTNDWSGLSAGDYVRPFIPSVNYQDVQPLGAQQGQVTIGGERYPITQLEFTVDLGLNYREDEFGAVSMQGAVPTQFRVTGTLQVRAREDLLTALETLEDSGFQVEIQLGGSAGRTWTFTMPNVVLPAAPIQTPAGAFGLVALPIQALASAPGAGDAISLVLS
jgi:hypothetical protein